MNAFAGGVAHNLARKLLRTRGGNGKSQTKHCLGIFDCFDCCIHWGPGSASLGYSQSVQYAVRFPSHPVDKLERSAVVRIGRSWIDCPNVCHQHDRPLSVAGRDL
jgi:hypothetical protein